MLHDDCLLHGDAEELARDLGVSIRTLQRYKQHPETMPEAVKKLLRLRLEGDLRAIGGNSWDGFYLQRGRLHAPLFERGFTAGQVRGLFFRVQQVAALEAELRTLRAELWATRKVRQTAFPASGMDQAPVIARCDPPVGTPPQTRRR